jgi:hypothetical protein
MMDNDWRSSEGHAGLLAAGRIFATIFFRSV